jgi:hypothetical protein
MKDLRKIFLILIIVMTAAFAFAADDTAPVRAAINKKRIFVGDRMRYTVEPASGRRAAFEIKFPQFKDGKIDDCEIKDSGEDWLDLTSYYVGKRKIPSIEVKYRKKGDQVWKSGKTNEIAFTVESVLPQGVKLYDIKDIKGPLYPFSILKLLMWIAVSFFLVLVLIKIAKALRKKAPPKLPHEVAFEELEKARTQFASGGDAKEYFVTVSDVIRRYIETVFSLRAPEMTTQEFLVSLNNSSKLPSGYKGSLKGFMEACDLVKFAKHKPSGAETDSALETAKKFIEETKAETDAHI